ncbi:hypothetical protein GJAV_G00109710 [Gymnothorax javanicus]|nr:hypothetical protein GJAV_G00109710 [Gymnothorax javanicus]
MKGQTQTSLKELKALWEETSLYITHCHSRIEWVWLHWSEYLKALEEFGRWMLRATQALDPYPELQLGVREKVWQLEQYRVLLDDARGHERSLNRLLEEASDLYERTEDPSVGSDAQDSLREAYTLIVAKAEERVSLLQKIAEEHRVFDASVHEFWTWLDSMSVQLAHYCETEVTPEKSIMGLQELSETVDREEATLQHLEGTAEGVKVNTSPLGADKVTREVERLRQAWEGLRRRLRVEEDRRRAALSALAERSSLCDGLQTEASRISERLQRLEKELEAEGRERGEEEEEEEEEGEVLWRKYTDLHRAVALEEPHVEQLKSRLSAVLHVSPGSGALCDLVLTVVKQYQGLKGRAFRLRKGSETALRQRLLDPLEGFRKWSVPVSQILEVSDEEPDFSRINLLLQSMKKLLKDGRELEGRLEGLRGGREGLLADVFGPEKAKSLGEELRGAMLEMKIKQDLLLLRKSRLQDLLSRSKDFGERLESVLKRLHVLRERFNTTDELKPDLLTKKALSGQLMAILKDLEKLEPQLTALQTLVPQNREDLHKLGHLCTEWNELCKHMKGRVRENERNAVDHQHFEERLQALEKGLQETRQRLEPYCSLGGETGSDEWQAEAEKVLSELSDRELELRTVEADGQRVLAKTSEEGKGKIQEDLQRLRGSWTSLNALSMDLQRFLTGDGVTASDSCVEENEREGAVQIETNMDSGIGVGEDILGKITSEQRSEDTSEGKGQEREFRTGNDEEYPGSSGSHAVENLSFGNAVSTEKGFGIDEEDRPMGQIDGPVGQFGPGGVGGSDSEVDGQAIWQDVKARSRMEIGDEEVMFGDELGGKGRGFRWDIGPEKDLHAVCEGACVVHSVRSEGRLDAEDKKLGYRKGFGADLELSTNDEGKALGTVIGAATVPRSGDEDIGVRSSRVPLAGEGDTDLQDCIGGDRVLGTGVDSMGSVEDLGAKGRNLQKAVLADKVLEAGVEDMDLGKGTGGIRVSGTRNTVEGLGKGDQHLSGFGATMELEHDLRVQRTEPASGAEVGNGASEEAVRAKAVVSDGYEIGQDARDSGSGFRADQEFCDKTEGIPVRQSVRSEGRFRSGSNGAGLGKGVWSSERLDTEDKDSEESVKPKVIIEASEEDSHEGGVNSAAWSGIRGEDVCMISMGSVSENYVRTEGVLQFGEEKVRHSSSENMCLGQGVRQEGVFSLGDEEKLNARYEVSGLGTDVGTKVGLGPGDLKRLGAGDDEGLSFTKDVGTKAKLRSGDEKGLSARAEGLIVTKNVMAEMELGVKDGARDESGDKDARWDFGAGERSSAGPIRAHVTQRVRAERVLGAGGEAVGVSAGVQAQESNITGGGDLSLDQVVCGKASLVSAGFRVGRQNEFDCGLDQGQRSKWTLDLGRNTAEVHGEPALRQQDSRAVKVHAAVQGANFGHGLGPSLSRRQGEGIKQQSGGSQTIYGGLSGKERGKLKKDESSALESSGTSMYRSSRRTKEEFQAWLHAENAKLSQILSLCQKGRLTDKELRLRQEELEELRSRVSWGQSFMQGLLTSQDGPGADDPDMEELRYRWMLYKATLQEAGDLKAVMQGQDSVGLQKEDLRTGKESSGLLRRVCCVALPLQLLLLSLLLFAFLLPLTDESGSCSLVNNFAHSFRLMLRYDSPPPT